MANADTPTPSPPPSMTRVLVTGASGFIGRHLVPLLERRGFEVVEAGRTRREGAGRFVRIDAVDGRTDWSDALAGADAVVHLAGIAHRDSGGNDPDLYFEVNDRGAEALARQAASAGARTMVLVSSVFAGHPDPTPYGASKRAGERHVERFGDEGGRRGIVLRPPLVYAADAPANWRRLQSLAANGLPLPFGAIAARRSLMAVTNLGDAVATAIVAGIEGKGGVYEVADAGTVTLADIIALLRQGMGRPRRLFPVPPALLRLAGTIAGQGAAMETLLTELVVDPAPFMKAFDWTPPLDTRDGIRRSGAAFLKGGGTISARR